MWGKRRRGLYFGHLCREGDGNSHNKGTNAGLMRRPRVSGENQIKKNVEERTGVMGKVLETTDLGKQWYV